MLPTLDWIYLGNLSQVELKAMLAWDMTERTRVAKSSTELGTISIVPCINNSE
jgi:hypothetical protein